MAPLFVIALTVFIYLKPMELFPLLSGLPILHGLFLGLVGSVLVDIARGTVKSAAPPQLPYVLAFALWATSVIAVREPGALPRVLLAVGIGTGIYWACAVGMGTPKRVWIFAGTLLVLAFVLASLAVYQSGQPFACFAIEQAAATDAPVYDGRPCMYSSDCEEGGRPGVDWICEKPGLFGTSSIGRGRVRYRGTLSDPNELSLVVASALPFAFALREKRTHGPGSFGPHRSGARPRSPGFLSGLLLAAVVALFGWCVVETQSRGGQLVFGTVVGLFFIRRFRFLGVGIGALAALPVVLWGGRTGVEADASSYDRVEAWYEGVTMIRDHPLLGVGPLQFVEHHRLTAHNAYLLTAAETGVFGFLLWTTCVYSTFKIPWTLWWQRDERIPASLVPLSAALLVAMAGMLVGVFFLSFAYHHVLYLFMGLAGALAIAAKAVVPEFDVRVSKREIALLLVVDLAFVVAMYAYTRIRG